MRAFNCEPRSNRQCMQYLFNYLFIKQTDDSGKSGGELGRLGRHRPWHVQLQPNTAIGKTATATANGHCKWHCAYVTCAQSEPAYQLVSHLASFASLTAYLTSFSLSRLSPPLYLRSLPSSRCRLLPLAVAPSSDGLIKLST